MQLWEAYDASYWARWEGGKEGAAGVTKVTLWKTRMLKLLPQPTCLQNLKMLDLINLTTAC